MVDPSEAEEQTKVKGSPPSDPRPPQDVTADEDGDGGFQTPPTGSTEPSPCHTAAPQGPQPDPSAAAPQGASPQPPPPPEEEEAPPKLHLDLYNFDSPAAEGSRYVLTSPRSLEACARCGVKPVELLPRPLADFAREAPGRSLRVATGMLEVHEKERRAKLRHCLEERERIVREEKRRLLQAAANSASSSLEKSPSGSAPKSKPAAASPPKDPASGPAPKTSKPPASSALGSSPKSCESSKPRPSRPPPSAPPPAARKSSGGKTSNTFPRSSPKPPAFPRANTTLSSCTARPERQGSGAGPNGVTGGGAGPNGVTGGGAGPNGATGLFSQHNGHLRSRVRIRSHSLESLQRRAEPACSSAASSTPTTTTCTSSESGGSSAYSWDGARDHWAKFSGPRARTMAAFNSLMGRSLSLGDLSHSPATTQKVERIVREVKRRGLRAVSERDRKIAALMLARFQEEDIMSQTRYVAHLQWDSERRTDELRREQEERDKQRAVLQCQRVWHTQVSVRQRRLSQRERDSAAAKMRQAEESEERWRELAERQERTRLLRLQQAAREERHRKALQEQNLKALEEERAAVLEQERLLLKEKLTMAELKRQEKEHQARAERLGLNKAEERRHAALIQEIARREQEEREEARRAAADKLSRSLENYEQIVERRGQELKEKARREERQSLKARRAAERREQQQRQQLEERAKEAQRRAQQAAAVAEGRAKEKAQRAVQSRQEKERLQKVNRQRVEEEERLRRLELLQSIERKLEKSEQIFKEKRAVLESARSVARASFHVRDKVREETNVRTFDKMALEAQLKASLDEK